MTDSKAIDEFVGKLKDPYYGRPVILEQPLNIGSAFTVMNTDTNEVIQCHYVAADSYQIWGNSRHLGDSQLEWLSHKDLEMLLARFWNMSQAKDVHWKIEDPTGCTLMSPTQRLI